MAKRLLDFAISLCAIALLLAPLAVLAVLIKLDSPGPVFFRQERIGRNFRPFFIWKFRTMVNGAPRLGGPITVSGDPRVTRLGRMLRRWKLDELPQLINVLKGDMSLVGPRPELAEYVERFRADYAEILKVRPGLTDPASLKYRDEEQVLSLAADPEAEYVSRVLPEKIRLAKAYAARASLAGDLKIMALTLRALFSKGAVA